MKRWICVILILPYCANSQTWSNQLAIPIHFSAYQKDQSLLTGLNDLPALLGVQKRKEIGIAIENKYSLAALNRLSLSIAHPLGSGSLSLNSSIQGGSLYTHWGSSINYGLTINKQSSIGVSIGVLHLKLKEETADYMLQTIAGVTYLINDKTLLAIHYQDIRQLGTTPFNKTSIPDGLIIGIGHQISRPVFIQIEIRKQEQIQLFPAINWKPNAKIGFWCGLNGTGQLAIGINGFVKKTTISIAMSSHPYLGYSLQLQMNKRLHDKE